MSKEPKQMIHFEDTAKEFVAELAKSGFNGVRLDECSIQLASLQDFEADGKTVDDYEAWRHDYAIMNIETDLEYHAPPQANRYVEVEVDRQGFYEDLNLAIRLRFGPDAKVNHRAGCGEWEVQRVSSDEDSVEATPAEGTE